MSDDTGKRVNPSDDGELNDEVLESVAGGCQVGCSNERSCVDIVSFDKTPEWDTLLNAPRLV